MPVYSHFARLSPTGPDSASPADRLRLVPMDYRGVRLGKGPLLDQMNEVKAFYLGVADDDLLKGYRLRAKRPAPGKDLGGWYTANFFHVFGQVISGLSRLHAATGDPGCRDKANRLVEGWADCIAPDGFFFAAPPSNAPHYVYDKQMWGLLDNYLYCGNASALDHASRITGWAQANLARSREVADLIVEWYTLSENLYRAYLITGDAKYRDFAETWEYTAFWDTLAEGRSVFPLLPGGGRFDYFHAYSHVNTLGSAAAAYLATGQSRYLTALIRAHVFLQREQVYATGGYGPDERLLPPNLWREKIESTHNTFETQCGAWAVFKLCKAMIALTGDARYGDWIERMVINGIGASLPSTPEGRVFYYADYNLHGGRKRRMDAPWPCCMGTRPQAVADYVDLIYFRKGRDLFVNLFAPSTATWDVGAGTATLTQRTDFLASGAAAFEIALDAPAEFTLGFRVPGWLASPMTATVNGEVVALGSGVDGWARIVRKWTKGDRVALTLPMGFRRHPLVEGETHPVAVAVGPTVLAFEAPLAKRVRAVDPGALDRDLSPVAGKPLEFVLRSNPEVKARPFHTYREDERYFLYLDPTLGNQIPYPDLRYTGEWFTAGRFMATSQTGAAVECDFEGTGVEWMGFRFDDAGRAEVAIDGSLVDVVDQYGPGRELPFEWSIKNLTFGKHTFRATVHGVKHEESKGYFINIAGVKMLGSGTGGR